LPEELVALADVAANGELFWPPAAAEAAARAIAGHGSIIGGGEVYARRSVGWAAYLGEWMTPASDEADGPGSSSDAAARGLASALSAIESEPAAWGETEATRDELRFFFSCRS
jgi:hypothetical protein